MPQQTTPTPDQIRARLDACTIVDAMVIRRRLRGLERRNPGSPIPPKIARSIEQQLNDSIQCRCNRAASIAEPKYPADLPVSQRREEILTTIRDHQVVVICGETGSGKTTQIPKMCRELGRGAAGMIGHTQPRRIAARAVATRIAEELGVPFGGPVGCKVRFSDQTTPETSIKLMTDGMLLSETQRDRGLHAYDTIIIDEAHERSLNIDFLLGYLHRILPKRRDLKLIITSATIDAERFSKHFRNAPIIEVSGRSYPVEIRHRPLVGGRSETAFAGNDADQITGVLDALDELCNEGPGDVLVFMSGEREIRQTARALRESGAAQRGIEILPLYARLSPAEQQRVFKPHPGRRVVIATNVAETSLTVPGIRYVIDPGEARIKRYSARTRVQGLQIEPISRASADQRAGRCGRVAPGICIRLYDADDARKREAFTPPEVLRTNLASVVLQMKALDLGRPEDFPFIEPPDSRLIRDGYETLFQLGAIDEDRNLTETGRKLAMLPIDPQIGRMVLAAADEDCVNDVLIIAAALSIQDPRDRPMDHRDAADAAHQEFTHPESDFLSYLNLWHFYHNLDRKLSRSKLKKALQQNFLSATRMREWRDVLNQLRELAIELGLRIKPKEADHDAIHRALLTGLIANVGRRKDKFAYEGTHSGEFHIFPGSTLFKDKPKWVMAAEIVRTTKRYARCVAAVEPKWVEEAGAHLIKRTYADPFWDERRQTVMARERVLLLGLEIAAQRAAPFGPVDPVKSREIFIHEGLVAGAINIDPPCLAHNRALAEQVTAIEAKARRDDLLADTQARFSFYDASLPDDIHSTRAFEKWLRRAQRKNPRTLYMSTSDLVLQLPESVDEMRFPSRFGIEGIELPLEYRHEPGADDDGVTVSVPIEFLGQVDRARMDWLVPGMIEDKIAALIRTLPKTYRRNFDANACARELASSIELGTRPIVDVLAIELSKKAGIDIPREAFKPDEIDRHLWMRYQIVDASGAELAAGRDLGELRAQLSQQIADSYAHASSDDLDRDDLTDWDFGSLPEEVEIQRGSFTLHGYPSLIDQGKTVTLRVLSSRAEARRCFRAGLARLYVRHLREEFKYHARNLPNIDQMMLWYAPLGPIDELKRDLLLLVADRVFIGDDDNIREREAFVARLDRGWNQLRPTVERVCLLVGKTLERYHKLAVVLSDQPPAAWAINVNDVRAHLGRLVPPRFLAEIPYQRLEHYPRYLRAIDRRLERLRQWGPKRDLELAKAVAKWQELCSDRQQKHDSEGVEDAHLDDFRWLIEEYRVSLFAQELGTVESVSDKRLEQRWQRVRS